MLSRTYSGPALSGNDENSSVLRSAMMHCCSSSTVIKPIYSHLSVYPSRCLTATSCIVVCGCVWVNERTCCKLNSTCCRLPLCMSTNYRCSTSVVANSCVLANLVDRSLQSQVAVVLVFVELKTPSIMFLMVLVRYVLVRLCTRTV